MEALRFPISDRQKLFEIIRARSFGRGKVKLASGRESDFYFDLKPTMFSPEGAALLPQLILAKLEREAVDAVGGLELGAVPLVACVAMLSAGRAKPLPGFIVRKRVKEHGTKKRIEGLALSRGESLAGKAVVIFDDVTTTGGSAMEAVEAAQEAGARVVMVLAVVDREEGALDFYTARGIRFEALFRASEFLKT